LDLDLSLRAERDIEMIQENRLPLAPFPLADVGGN
jgi:hypothetical protein